MAIYAFEGREPVIHHSAYMHESAQVIGDVVLGEECFVGAGSIIRGDYSSIRLGDRVAVEEGCIIHAPPGETGSIGSDVTLGHGAIIHGSQIGDNVRIGMGAITGFHSVIEDWVILGDGAVLPPKKTLSGGMVYMGNPAKEVRLLSDDERVASGFVVRLYADLAGRYHRGLRRLS